MAKLTEGRVAKTIWLKYGTSQTAAANIYYYAFESDVLILRNSGTVVEYEIKLSVQDYKAGLKKRTRLNQYNKNKGMKVRNPDNPNVITRHEYLTQGLGANMFYYVMPAHVIEAVEIPQWAGIIQVQSNTAQKSCGMHLVKKAPYLHKGNPDEKIKAKILASCYFKYWQHFAVDDITEILKRTTKPYESSK